MIKSIEKYAILLVLVITIFAPISIATASLPYPDIELTQTNYDMGEPVNLRVRILTMAGVPTQMSGFRLIFTTPAGVKIRNFEEMMSETWYKVKAEGVTTATGVCTVVGELPDYGTFSSILTYTVMVTKDFSLAITPTSVTSKQGDKASFNISVAPIGEYIESVTLKVTGFPNEASAVFSPQSGKPPLTSTLTIDLPPSTPEGNYTLTIEASGKVKTHSTEVTLRIKKEPTHSEQLFGKDLSALAIVALIIGIVAVLVFVVRKPSILKRQKHPPVTTEYQSAPTPAQPSIAMSRKYCVNCGASLPQKANYCGKCGTYQDR